ncbi:MAG: hypothetical protein IKT86_00405 [Bacteroidaceae bacterium]|nr:hypothetical protein [Bacteroidaceae bacterium]
MRKEYIKPEIEVVVLEAMSMLAVSSGGNIKVDGETEIDPDNGSELSNRRRNFWNEIDGGW